MTLTDTQRLWREIRDAGTRGLHSWDVYGWTRNGPQRAKDVVDKGQVLYKRPERRNGRPGVRWWLEGFQPDDAELVPGNGPGLGGGGSSMSQAQQHAAAEPSVVVWDFRPGHEGEYAEVVDLSQFESITEARRAA